MIPLRTDSPLRRTPWMNIALIVANVVVFMAQQAFTHDHYASLLLDPVYPRLSSFFTYAFLHHDMGHLFGNMLFLYIFGNNVNDKLGHASYLAFYLAGGVFAGTGHAMVSENPVLGASGAVAAVTGAYIILFPRAHVTILYFWGFIGTIDIPSIWFILVYFLKDLFMSSGGADNVAHMAHIAGTIFGCVVCTATLVFNLVPRSQFDIVSIFKHWNRRRQFRDMVAGGYNPFGVSTDQGSRRAVPNVPNPRLDQIMTMRAQISDSVSRNDLNSAADLYLQLLSIDPRQVLARQAQLDIANHFASRQQYQQAVNAYELLLGQYPNFDQIEHVQLMTGLIYARYLQQYARARQLLQLAIQRLHDGNATNLAKEELARIEPLIQNKPA